MRKHSFPAGGAAESMGRLQAPGLSLCPPPHRLPGLVHSRSTGQGRWSSPALRGYSDSPGRPPPQPVRKGVKGRDGFSAGSADEEPERCGEPAARAGRRRPPARPLGLVHWGGVQTAAVQVRGACTPGRGADGCLWVPGACTLAGCCHVAPMKEVTASLGLVPQPCVSPPVQPVSHAFPTPFPRDPLSTDLHTIPLRLSWLFL